MGRRLIETLLQRGHRVRALARAGSEKRLPAGCEIVPGDALSAESMAPLIAPADTFVQLVGTAHPHPAKGAQFRSVDFVAGCAGANAAAKASVKHFVYVSVAYPAPMMKAYIEVRSSVEEHIQKSGLEATILRPWYVLGPGRRWPLLLKPIYALMKLLPATRESATRLGLLTDEQMNAALVQAVEQPAMGIRIWNVQDIRKTSL
jgi:uncharacterized protein YbjT (DUF2867 family)